MRDDNSIDDTQAPLIEHLRELRTRLIYALMALGVCMIIAFVFAPEIYQFLARPLSQQLNALGVDPRQIVTSPQEKLFTDLSIAFYFGFFIGFPIIATQLWRFVAPGLYAQEKQAFWPFLVASPILFLLGAMMIYYVISPLMLDFFLTYTLGAGEDEATAAAGGGTRIEVAIKVNEYLSLIMNLIFAFGLAFQLPILLTLLGRAGILTADDLIAGRKYAVVGILAMAAVLTPPDVFSQIGLGVPVYLLYEISIFLTRRFEQRKEAELRAEGYYGDD